MNAVVTALLCSAPDPQRAHRGPVETRGHDMEVHR